MVPTDFVPRITSGNRACLLPLTNRLVKRDQLLSESKSGQSVVVRDE